MADVGSGDGGGGGRHHQKKRAKKLSTRIDMTPMVDLGFLLLTFFMLTTTFSQPKVIELTPPIKTDVKTKVQDTLSLTLILGKSDTVWYYNGQLSPNADSANNMMFTDYSDNGMRKIILNRNFYVRNLIKPYEEQLAQHKIVDTTFARLKEKQEENKFAIFVIIKTDTTTKYINVVRALDEMNICDVGKYSLIDVTDDDMKMIADYKQKHHKP
jgi:biopolymer transport protein ExbD